MHGMACLALPDPGVPPSHLPPLAIQSDKSLAAVGLMLELLLPSRAG